MDYRVLPSFHGGFFRLFGDVPSFCCFLNWFASTLVDYRVVPGFSGVEPSYCGLHFFSASSTASASMDYRVLPSFTGGFVEYSHCFTDLT